MPDLIIHMNRQFSIDSSKVLYRWVEDHDGMKFHYVAHERAGKLIYSYSNYADPLESNTKPFDRASFADTSTASPLTKMRSDG